MSNCLLTKRLRANFGSSLKSSNLAGLSLEFRLGQTVAAISPHAYSPSAPLALNVTNHQFEFVGGSSDRSLGATLASLKLIPLQFS